MRFNRVFVAISAALMVSAVAAAAAGESAGSSKNEKRHSRQSRYSLDQVAVRPTGPQKALAEWPGLTNNFELLGHAKLKNQVGGDVLFFDHGEEGKFAYVGNWAFPCPGSVSIFNVTDPNNPQLVAEAAGRKRVDFQDMAVATIGGRDIMGVGLQICNEGGKGGLGLYDVTDPANPTFLSFLKMPSGGVHELDFAVRADGQVLALLAVPFAEGPNGGGDFHIADITDPENPVKLTDWGIITDSDLPRPGSVHPIELPCQGLGSFPCFFLHSIRSADDGLMAYASYWDAGVLKFDLTDPANPELIGRTTFPVVADGDAHSLTPYDAGSRYILQNQEDFDPGSPVSVTSSVLPETVQGAEEYWMPTTLTERGAVTGEFFNADDGCQPEDFNNAAGKIALIDWPDPFFGGEPECGKAKSMINAAEAGVSALVINVISEERPFVFPVAPKKIAKKAPDLVVVEISSLDPLAETLETVPGIHTLTLTPNTPSWGTLLIFSEAQSSDVDGDGVLEFEQVGEFNELPNVTGALGDVHARGSWSIHNTEVNGNRAYSAWYSHGIVAIDLTIPTDPQLVGQWVPPSNNQHSDYLGKGPAEMWGVDIDPLTGIIYASDMRRGLWVIQPTGPALPTP
jgi:hypothetical protein